MTTKYNPLEIEEKWYKYWLDNNLFAAKPNPNKKPYTVVIPPPNVTGILHMGHMLNNTIQDVLVRKARMEGREACWVPGTDHASIATEARVVAMLKEKGISKTDLSRDEFLKYAWEWKEKYGGIILEQLQRIGASCDWSRTRFTMEPSMYLAVQKVFVDLYNQGLIYRGSRIVSWDPQGKTALSDDEVIHKPTQTDLVYIKYKISDSSSLDENSRFDKFITIATTRPETIFGDVAICINPNDERYTYLQGKFAIIPIVNKVIPIIFDSYVDMEFGTGCLKITPAHDLKDYELSLKHKLPSINILNEDGSLNENALQYAGQDRFIARKNVVKELKNFSLIEKIETITNNVGYSERTNAVVEPRISTQWFVKMKNLAEPALEHVLDGTIKFHPNKFQNMYRSWLENIKDWCISRQLWWGHRIPAYYLADGRYVVALTIEEALANAKILTNNPNLKIEDLSQDEDVLDTWFSSWIWPIEVFDGLQKPENEDFKYFYPTNDLVTAPEIIFFWVARMIMAGYAFTEKAPFKNVYFTGIVRDKQNRKMSKSLGNSPDPIDLVAKYGADGVRVGMLLCAPAGNDLLFDEKLCEQGRNFANKIWNASLLIKKWQPSEGVNMNHSLAIKWFYARLQASLKEINNHFSEFRLSQALMCIYKLVWDDFCSIYLEMIKPVDGLLDSLTYTSTLGFLENILKLLHPFTPFLTEEIWQKICIKDTNRSIMLESWSIEKEFSNDILDNCTKAFEFIASIRNAKIENKAVVKEYIDIFYITPVLPSWLKEFEFYIKKFAHVNDFIITENLDPKIVCIDFDGLTFFLDLNVKKNSSEERLELEKELVYFINFLGSVEKKLNNQKFIEKASEDIIQNEKNKQLDALTKIKSIKNRLLSLDMEK